MRRTVISGFASSRRTVTPTTDTIARFRRENFAAVSESFLQVLLLAKELKLLRVGLVSVDGSKFKANASKHRSVTYERAGALIAPTGRRDRGASGPGGGGRRGWRG